MSQVSDFCTSTVGVPDLVEGDDGFFLMMPFMNHGSLLDLLRECEHEPSCKKYKNRRWKAIGKSNAYVLALFHDAVRGVEALHSKKIIHTDLKLENVMVNCIGTHCSAAVIDLGLACYRDEQWSCGSSGTPSYLAPEVWKGNRKMMRGFYRDVWSLGVMLYLLTYSKPPPFYRDGTGQKQMAYSPRTDPVFESHSPLDLLISQMLEPDPSYRISIRNTLQYLEQILENEEPTDEISSMIDSSPSDRGAIVPSPKCLFVEKDPKDYDLGDAPFARRFCHDAPEKARGYFSCGDFPCLGCNPCCKCRVKRHGKLVKEHFRMQTCE